MIQDLKGSMQSLPLYASRFMEMICAILGNYKETCYAAYKSMATCCNDATLDVQFLLTKIPHWRVNL